MKDKDIQRFFKRVDKYSDYPCWRWEGAESSRRCNFWYNQKTIRPRKFSFLLHKGIEPTDYLHSSCGNFWCVNPDHIVEGYDKEKTPTLTNRSKRSHLSLLGKRFGRLVVTEQMPGRYYRNLIWKCQCDCGEVITAPTSKLTCGTKKSCGCLSRETGRISGLKRYKGGPDMKKHKFSSYRRSARERGLSFELSFNQFIDLIERECRYCKNPPLNGVDRFDNLIGYTQENCVPCCSKCNYAKRDMDFNDFKEWVKRLHENLIQET